MAMTARGGTNDGPDPKPSPTRTPFDWLRYLAIGAELHSKGPRHFAVYVRPFGIVIEATDRSLVRKIVCSAAIPFDAFNDMSEGALKSRLAQIDAELDHEIRAAE